MALRTLIAGLVLAAPLATQALAQANPPPAPGAAPAASRAPAVKSDAARSAAIERRIADIHSRLKITPAEQKPFDDFAQVMRDNAQRMAGLVEKRQETAASGSAVDQMRSYSDMAQAHADDMQHLTTAFSALYEALSPDQRKLADTSFRQFASSRRGAAG